MFSNRYAGCCEKCKVGVPADKGFIQKVNGRYIVWCKSCVPSENKISKELTEDGRIIMPYDAAALPLIKSLPGPNGTLHPKWDKPNNCWWVSIDMADRHRLLEIANRLDLSVPQSMQQVDETSQSQQTITAGLYPYQIEGVNFISHKNKCLLSDEMGLGKTAQSLMAVKDCALIICPASLKYNWMDEIIYWRKDLNPIVIKGRGNFRWPNKGEIVIVNYHILPEEYETPEQNKGEPMQQYWQRLAVYRKNLEEQNSQAKNVHLIIDEAHNYKNYKAARCRKVKEIVRLSKKVTGLTGSPLTNKPADLFGVLNILGLSKEVFGTWERFQTLFNVEKEIVRTRRGPITKIVWGKPQPIVPELLRQVMLRRKRVDVLPDLPQKTYTNLMVGDIDSTLQKSLDDLWKDWKNTIEIRRKLPPFELFSSIRAALTKSRIPAMLEYIEDTEEQEVPLVVFSNYLSPLDAILGRPGWAVLSGDTKPDKRQNIIRAFQAGKLKGIGLTYKVGGVGINLTHAWKLLQVDMSWSPADNWQAEDRVCRLGQLSNKIEIVRMMSDHPLDIHVHNVLANKIDMIIRTIDSAIIKSVRVGETEEQYLDRVNQIFQEAAALDAEIYSLA